MKNLILACLILACGFSSRAFAGETLTMVKKGTEATADLNAFKNLETKLESLDDYSVTYVEADKSFTVMKEASAVARRPATAQVNVKLISKKRTPAT